MFHLIRVRFAHPPAGFPKECLRHGRWLVQYPVFSFRVERIYSASTQALMLRLGGDADGYAVLRRRSIRRSLRHASPVSFHTTVRTVFFERSNPWVYCKHLTAKRRKF